MERDPHQLAPDHLPTPFTAAEIRAAFPAGRTIRYLVERAGQEPAVRVTRYAAVDADGAIRESWPESRDGAILGEAEQERSTWLELQQHASFPAAITERDDEAIDTPAGHFNCLRYTRTDEGGTWRFWFARESVGQPVRFEHEVTGQVVFSSILIEDVAGDPT
jgi:hypothetical protein